VTLVGEGWHLQRDEATQKARSAAEAPSLTT
jgi:hypothetical protein